MQRDESTPLPVACVICGTDTALDYRVIEKTYIPGWVWLLLPLGVLPAALVSLAVQTKHRFTFHLCTRCSGRRMWSGAVHWLAMITCLILLFVAIGLGMATRSWFLFLLGIAVMIAVAAVASWFDKRVNPHYLTFSDKRVEVEVPGHGSFVVYPPFHLLPPSTVGG